MPLVECPKCRAGVTDTVEVCPSCGHPLKGSNQPKIDASRPRRRPSTAFYVLLAVIAAGMLAVILFQAVLFWK